MHALPRALLFSAVGCLILIGLGGYLAAVVSIPWSLPLFTLGLGGLAAVIARNRRYRHDVPELHRAIQIADSVLVGVLLVGILFLGNVFAYRYADRPLDFTQDQSFSLSDLSVRQIRTLDQPVSFTLFHGTAPLANRQRLRVEQLLDLYKAVNPGRVRIEDVARYADPSRFEDLVKRVPEVALMSGGGVVVELGEGPEARHTVANFNDLFVAAPNETPDRFVAQFQGEDFLTSALIRLREGSRMRIGFTTGHGEPAIDNSRDPEALGLFRSRLASLGAELLSIDLTRDPVPSGVDILFVVRPRTGFAPAAAERLRSYFERGGRLVILTGRGGPASHDGSDPASLDTWLGGFGIQVGHDRILDSRYNAIGRSDLPLVPIVARRDTHPIVAPLDRQAILIPGAVPLLTAGETGQLAADSRWRARVILKTSPDARLTRADAAGQDQDKTTSSKPALDQSAKPVAPFGVGMVVTEAPREPGKEESPRLVVFSSPYMADNELVSAAPANQNLLVNAVGWLKGRVALIGIAPKTHVALTLTADPGLRSRLVLIPTVLAFTLIISFGVWVYLSRRS